MTQWYIHDPVAGRNFRHLFRNGEACWTKDKFLAMRFDSSHEAMAFLLKTFGTRSGYIVIFHEMPVTL